jgi:hypothetical protein
MNAQLRPNGQAVRLGPYTIRSPGLAGKASYDPAVPRGARGEREIDARLEQALEAEQFTTAATIELTKTREVAQAQGLTRGTRIAGEPAIEFDAPAPEEGMEQAVLVQDECGVMTWNFVAETENEAAGETDDGDAVGETENSESVVRGRAMRRYLLRRYVPQPDAGEATTRGLMGAIGAKIIRVLAFPIERAGGGLGAKAAAAWEERFRSYGLRMIGPDDYAKPSAYAADTSDLQQLGEEPVLLVVHGTFSRVHAMLASMPPDVFVRLHRHYGGRVLAFDHFTLSHDPKQNVSWLLERLPKGKKIVFDVLCHSRGGLVARTLTEKLAEIGSAARIEVRNLVLAAAPDAGTALSSSKHVGDFADAFMNLMNFFPDNGALDALQCVLTLVRHIASGTADQLAGLTSMLPKGPFQNWLNSGPKGATRYFALASDYAPTAPGLREWGETRLMEAIFRESNDLVVPTAGVWDTNGAGAFPISDRWVFDKPAGVNHGGYFQQPVTHERLADWLALR